MLSPRALAPIPSRRLLSISSPSPCPGRIGIGNNSNCIGFSGGEEKRGRISWTRSAAMATDRLAPGQLKAVDGLHDLCKWIEGCNLKRAAVTNAPRANAELMLSLLGLTDFFPVLVIGSECDRAKPFPDPYLKALELIGASPDHTFIFEDSASGTRAGVAARVPVVGLTTRNPGKVLSDAGASLVIKDFQDPKLLSVLEEIKPPMANGKV
ncbi:unnamed protein product [Urochloa humidicola]